MVSRVQRYFLEIKDFSKLVDLNLPENHKIILDDKRDFQLNKFFYKQIGIDHYWRDRLVWSDKEWFKYVSNKNLETSVPTFAKEVKKDEVLVDNSKKISSPIIGTAYLAPEPGGKKFIEVGQKIKKGDTVMIVEAMKTMNHVPSPIDGTVKEICVDDGQPVEFGQTIATLD